MFRSMTKRGMPRPFAILVATLMALYFVPLGALPAQAATVGGFEIEGDLVDDTAGDPPIDWFDLAPGSPGFSTGVDNTTLTGQDDTVFSGSSKEYVAAGSPGGWPAWTYGTGNATGKSDFGRWATYDYVDASDDVWFFLGFDRKAGQGTAKYVFELNQVTQDPKTDPNPVRSQGDLRLVVWDQGGGLVTLTGDSKNTDVGLYRWVDADQAAGGLAVDSDNDGQWVKITDSGVFAGASNTGETPISVPSWWTSGNVAGGMLDQDEFLEFGINLTSFGAAVGCPSAGFTAVNSRSITGTGGPGTLVDYLEAIPVTIPSDCASLVIHKQDESGAPLGGATFRIEPNPLPVGAPGRPTDNFLTIFDDSGSNTTVETGTNYDDPDATAGLITLAAVVPDVEYTITEIAPPEGYIGETGSKTVTPEPFGGGGVTFTNSLGSVKFFKSYAGPNGEVPEGATFLLERDALEPADPDDSYDDGETTVQDNGTNDADPTLGQIKVVDLLTGDYRLTETEAPLGWVADGDTVYFAIPGADNTAHVVLDSPTFTNPRATHPLTVRKVAKDDGALVPGAVFNLYRESNDTAGLQLGGDTLVDTCTTGSDGECSVPGLAWGESYYWYELSVPAPYNLPDNRVNGPIQLSSDGTSVPGGVSEFEDPESVIVTSATNGALPTGSISDSATLSGVRQDAGGSIVFELWDDATCSGDPIFTSTPVAVSGPGTYGPVTTTVASAGAYYWIATYSGDPATGTLGVAGECGDEGETSTVVPAQPGIVTVVPDFSVALTGEPTQLTDTATLSGASANATGTITFRLYGPFGADPGRGYCTAAKLFGTVGSVGPFSGNGRYTSEPLTITQTGFYTWRATYSGDADNKSATHPCGQAAETVEVTKTQPQVTTEAQQDEVRLGSLPTMLTDEATLSGTTANSSGSVTFSLYGPFADDPGTGSCTEGNLVQTVGSVGDFAGDGTYASMPVVVAEVGYYTWVATYSGDSNNALADHVCGQAVETTVVLPARPAITTTAGADQVVGVDGAALNDTAQLSGATAGATGSVTFELYGPFATDPTGEAGSCVEGKLVGTVVRNGVTGNGSYVSPDVTVTKTGYYVWVASYSGDDNNVSATHPCGDAAEVVRVTPRQPVITTDVPGSNTLTLGANGVGVSDAATLSQATSDAGGSISFQLYGPFQSSPTVDSCTEATETTEPVGTTSPVSGNGTYTSPEVTVTQAGFYTWIATYGGDADNNSATHVCGLAEETVEVQKARTSISTDVVDSTLQLAPTALLQDTATLSGATVSPAAGGTLAFSLFGPFASDPTDAQGDSTLCNETNLVGPPVGSTTSVSGPGTYLSQQVAVSEAGWYVWLAAYSGDANNHPSTHGCGDAREVTHVEKATPAITTHVPSPTARLAPTVTLNDTATLTGATKDPAAAGFITFSLYGPFTSDPGADSCTEATPIDSRTVPVNGPGSYTPATGITVNVAGFYTWIASYGGDENNESATHECGLPNETVQVQKAQGTITTDAVDHVRLSAGTTTISDEATLAGVTVDPAATGTIAFEVYGPFAAQPGVESCTEDMLVGGGPYTVTVNGPGTYDSPEVQVKLAGYYVWVATYSGDADNESATHPCGQTEETTIVQRARPTITTHVAVASVNLPDASLVDSATLAGGTTDPKATGIITFRLYGPFAAQPTGESCSEGTLVSTSDVNVASGNGSYVSPAVVVTEAGYYTWVATYSGDANNESATHACGLPTETVLVEKAPTDLTTVATAAATIKLGQTITDAASVTGLTRDATGSVTFSLFGPDDTTCAGTPVFTSTVPLVLTVNESGAAGSATSAAFTPTAAGTYRWIATYSGDASNAVSAGECNDPNEQSTVSAGDKPGLDKFSDPASGGTVQPGSTINYSVKVFNTGDVAITDADVVDVLPPHVTVNPASISDAGVLSADKTTITWKVTLAPADASSTADEKTFTYSATVNQNAPEGAVLVNTARFQGLVDTTTHVVPTGDLTVLKEVGPVAGNGVVVDVGDELTYTLTVTASGALNQTNVVVTDYVPGFDPARAGSGSTTYVPGSAVCLGAGTCTVTEPGADGLITWSLGSMAAGTSRQVTFKVTIDQVEGAPGESVAVDILNAGAVQSSETPKTLSNEVVTPVTQVFPVKVGQPPTVEPTVLPRTGAAVPPGILAAVAITLLGLGLALLAAGRRRGRHRLG